MNSNQLASAMLIMGMTISTTNALWVPNNQYLEKRAAEKEVSSTAGKKGADTLQVNINRISKYDFPPNNRPYNHS